ncbi:hypothetical protein Hoch_5400 [Haliangium ochraceum DSM 14365]|uniref:Uncharacterized protein n=2 Tax=Haliangium ochraceum TaxID=80816 RepID=D0LYL8_HALO1|nr:hypothetical protein Hoch_5400 [Haliangium ochraceum DSM 14365]
MSTAREQGANRPSHTLERLSLLPMERLEPAATVDVGPAVGSSRLELPGPARHPTRPYLEPRVSAAGIAARILRGDGTAMALAALGEKLQVLALPAPPLAVSARSDGLWAMYRERLVHHDAAGAEVHSTDLAGITLVPGAEDAVWVVGLNQARLVDRAGTVRVTQAWRGGANSFGAAGALCARAPGSSGKEAALRCLDPDGALEQRALQQALLPLEQPLLIEEGTMVTLQGTTVRVRRADTDASMVAVRSAGLDASGQPFLLLGDDELMLVHADGKIRDLPAPTGAARLTPRAAIVARDSVKLYGGGQVLWYRSDAAPEPAQLDEAGYREDFFPEAWQLAPQHPVVAMNADTVLISTSGPEGLLLLRLRLP